MKFLLVGFFLLIILSCAIERREPIAGDASIAFQKGLDLMKERDYARASEYWKRFLKEKPVSPLSPSAYYLLARSQEKTGQCHAAIPNYRNAYALWGASPSQDKARVKLRLAACYVQIGRSDLAIAELSEIGYRRNYYSWEDFYIERNALFAIAYAKEKNNKMAKKHYAFVDRYVKKALNSKREVDRVWLANLFLQLSNNIHNVDSKDISPKALEAKQSYLVPVIEWDLKPQSEEALKDLKKSYNQAGQELMDPSTLPAEGLKKMEEYKKRREKLESMLANLKLLEVAFSPAVEENQYIKNAIKWLGKKQLELQNFINQPLPHQELTPAAKKRQGIEEEASLVPVEELPKKDPNL